MFFPAILFVKFQIYFSDNLSYVVLAGEFDGFNESANYKSKGYDINHLKLIRKINLNKLVVAHLNINSIRNKFEALIHNVSGEVDLMMISETKIDESFPKCQFLILFI